jgi:hypothetical protein
VEPSMSVKRKVTVPVGRLGKDDLPRGKNGPRTPPATFAREGHLSLGGMIRCQFNWRTSMHLTSSSTTRTARFRRSSGKNATVSRG